MPPGHVSGPAPQDPSSASVAPFLSRPAAAHAFLPPVRRDLRVIARQHLDADALYRDKPLC
jgi:hypothetical protein